MHPDAVAQHKVLPQGGRGWHPGRRGIRPGGPGVAIPGRGLGPGRREARCRAARRPRAQLSLKPIVCPHCGGQVDASTATLNPEGTLTVTCGYCKGTFLIQEEPKW